MKKKSSPQFDPARRSSGKKSASTDAIRISVLAHAQVAAPRGVVHTRAGARWQPAAGCAVLHTPSELMGMKRALRVGSRPPLIAEWPGGAGEKKADALAWTRWGFSPRLLSEGLRPTFDPQTPMPRSSPVCGRVMINTLMIKALLCLDVRLLTAEVMLCCSTGVKQSCEYFWWSQRGMEMIPSSHYWDN